MVKNISTVLFFLFLFLISSNLKANQYDGEWIGELTSCKDQYYPLGKFRLEILNGKAELDHEKGGKYDYMDNRYIGKVLNKNKIGMNGYWGNVRGKFLSLNKLELTHYGKTQEKNCTWLMTRLANNENYQVIDTSINKKTQNADLLKLLKKDYQQYKETVFNLAKENEYSCYYKKGKVQGINNKIINYTKKEYLKLTHKGPHMYFYHSDDYEYLIPMTVNGDTLQKTFFPVVLSFSGKHKKYQENLDVLIKDKINTTEINITPPGGADNQKYTFNKNNYELRAIIKDSSLRESNIKSVDFIFQCNPLTLVADKKNNKEIEVINLYEDKDLDQLIFENIKDTEKNANNNDLYLSVDAILGEWEGTASFKNDEYPVYVIFDLNSKGELVGKYNYGTKNNYEKGGDLSLIKDDKNKQWKKILKLQRRFAMEWNEGNENGWFTFQVSGNKKILGFWGNDIKTRTDYGGSYNISKISNNIPKLGNIDNFNTVEVIEDTLSPKITVENKFIADENFTANVNGIVTDDSEIVFFSIDGEEVAINNNQFSSSFYVKSKGRLIEIIAIDTKGNKTSKFVELKRQNIEITKKVFDNLDPRKIKIPKRQNTAALIIGIENYENTVSAPFAENDALTFQDFALLTLGVPQENMKILINNEAKKTNTLKSILKWLPQVIKEDQTELYVFFSGHGLASENGEELYLLPSDGDPELLADSTLFRNRMFEDINKLNPKTVTVFLDTCYSGGTRSDEFLVAAKPIFIEAEEQEVPTNFTIFSASAGKETAKVFEEAEHGLFSYFMMKGLEGEADSNNDRTITNGELHAFINKNVSRQANQTPQLNGDPEQVLVQW